MNEFWNKRKSWTKKKYLFCNTTDSATNNLHIKVHYMRCRRTWEIKEKFRTILQNITIYETDESSLKPKRTSSFSSSSTLLPQDKCIFCNKTKKYKSKKVENLCTWDLKQVKEKIEQCAKVKANHCITVIQSVHDLIAAEGKYHPSCYETLLDQKNQCVINNQWKMSRNGWLQTRSVRGVQECCRLLL